MKQVLLEFVCWSLLFCTLAAANGYAEEAEPATRSAPVTTDDERIPLPELEILVKPLLVPELEREAEAWMSLLHAKAGAIATMQIAVRRENEAMEAAAEANAETGSKSVGEAAGVVEDVSSDTKQELADAEAPKEAVSDPASPIQSGDPDAWVDAAGEIKLTLLEQVTELRNEQTALIDRLNIVLDSLEDKGGDPERFRKYVYALSGVDVDVSDADATWTTIRGWLLSEEGGQRWFWNIVQFVLVLVLTGVIARILGKAVKRVASRSNSRMSKLARDAVSRAARGAVWVLGLLMAITMLEVNITPMLAAIGAAGLVVGLALQGTLSNIASGVMILLNRPFDVGDVVNAAGVTGKITEMSLVATMFRTFDNQTIIVPNNEIWGQVITNITANDTRRIDMVFGVGYSDDLDKAERILSEIVEGHDLILKDPAPVVRVHELGDSSVNIICRPWARTADYFTVYWDITRQVKDRFDQESISIPFPQRDVHIIERIAEE